MLLRLSANQMFTFCVLGGAQNLHGGGFQKLYRGDNQPRLAIWIEICQLNEILEWSNFLHYDNLYITLVKMGQNVSLIGHSFALFFSLIFTSQSLFFDENYSEWVQVILSLSGWLRASWWKFASLNQPDRHKIYISSWHQWKMSSRLLVRWQVWWVRECG